MTTDTKIPALTELEQRRQALAFDVEQGRDGATQELEMLEQQIFQLKRHQERQALAERERAMRAEAETQAAAEAERRQAQERLNYVLIEVDTAALEVEAAWIKLEQAAKGLLELGRSAYSYDNALRPGRPRQKLGWPISWPARSPGASVNSCRSTFRDRTGTFGSHSLTWSPACEAPAPPRRRCPTPRADGAAGRGVSAPHCRVRHRRAAPRPDALGAAGDTSAGDLRPAPVGASGGVLSPLHGARAAATGRRIW
jgi:hypothetical protein